MQPNRFIDLDWSSCVHRGSSEAPLHRARRGPMPSLLQRAPPLPTLAVGSVRPVFATPLYSNLPPLIPRKAMDMTIHLPILGVCCKLLFNYSYVLVNTPTITYSITVDINLKVMFHYIFWNDGLSIPINNPSTNLYAICFVKRNPSPSKLVVL